MHGLAHTFIPPGGQLGVIPLRSPLCSKSPVDCDNPGEMVSTEWGGHC